MRSMAVLVVAVAILAGTSLLADVAPVMYSGATGIRPKDADTPVAMAWEEVDLYPSPEKTVVKAAFGLKNAGTKDVQGEVGFPVFPGTDLHDFTVMIDGAEKPEVKKSALPKEAQASGEGKGGFGGPPPAAAPGGLRGGAAPGGFGASAAPGAMAGPAPVVPKGGTTPSGPTPRWAGNPESGAWMCWTMTFPAGRERKVVVQYWIEPEVRPHGFLKEAAADVRDKTALRTSGYVLRTGRYWSGNIGRAVVRLHYSDAFKKPLVRWQRPPWPKAKPPAAGWKYDASAAVDTLTLAEFKPDWSWDIEFAFKRVTADEEVALLTGLLKEQKLNRWGRQYLADLFDPKGGMPLSEAECQARLLDIYPYCVPPAGPALTADDMKNDIIVCRGDGLAHRAFRALCASYREGRKMDHARALAPHYEGFLKQGLDLAKQASAAFAMIQMQMAQQGAEPQAVEAFRAQLGLPPETLKKMEAELAGVSAFLAGGHAAGGR